MVSLLEKLPPETIVLDPQQIGSTDRDQKERQREAAAGKAARLAEAEGRKRIKKKTRGRSKIGKRLAKKAGNVVDEKRQKRLEELEQRRADREKRKKGAEKAWQFMLRLKVPSGECPGPLYLVLDDLCERFGQRDLRMTTRQAFQIHGISKANLKHVIRTIMEAGSTTIGGCGDINRNVMAPPVPMVEGAPPAYRRVGAIAAICAELFVPQTEAFSEIWCDGDKLASVQYWKRHLVDAVTGGGTPTVENFAKADELRVDAKMQEWMRAPDGHGVVLDHPVEPIYGDIYLPRKFKIGVTVEGDNSIDVFINDIGIVVKEDLSGANVYVGGGLGRTHGKETTFARAASPLGFFTDEELVPALKAVVAAQRDHGNREVRANARLKYLVHTLGVDDFRTLVEQYHGKVRPTPSHGKAIEP